MTTSPNQPDHLTPTKQDVEEAVEQQAPSDLEPQPPAPGADDYEELLSPEGVPYQAPSRAPNPEDEKLAGTTPGTKASAPSSGTSATTKPSSVSSSSSSKSS
jgi:hypothetical protein